MRIKIVKQKIDIIKNNVKVGEQEKTLYLFDGQFPDNTNTNVELQKHYKKLFELQTELDLQLGRPCSYDEIITMKLIKGK